MRVGLLGPVYVSDGQRPHQPLSPALCALVAVLAASNSAVASSELLISAIWHEPPSARRVRNLQFHVCKLRAVLRVLAEADGSARIVTCQAGYQLRLFRGELDSEEFKRQLWHAQEQARSGNLARAAQAYQEALSLWRGSALAGTAARTPWLAAEAAALEELHTLAYEEATDIALASGQHHAILAGLIAMAMRHPARERLTRQLMIALHRCGRQAEALHAYSAYRRTLRDDFGLDPSSGLQRLHQLVLAGDPAVDARRPGTDPAR